MRLLAISGSLRAVSSNTTLLRAAALIAPDAGITLYAGLDTLPHFNPDLDTGLDDPNVPATVRELRAAIDAADGILISSPEYAHGVPGSLKNALDWLVGSSEFPGKPVALINASPHSMHAQASLAETLRTMSAELVAGSPFPIALPDRSMNETAAAADPGVAAKLMAVLAAIGAAIEVRHAGG